MSLLSVSSIKAFYRKYVPLCIVENTYVKSFKEFIVRRYWHNAIYDKEFYMEDVEVPALLSAGIISQSILDDFKPKSVIDVGCGTGALLHSLQQKGCQAVGLEYADAGLDLCREKGLEVYKFNIKKDTYKTDRHFDLVVSMEVAEHIPENYSDNYINLLTSLANTVVFTSAPPGQGGTDHVNEQPSSYWISKFNLKGFICDEETSSRWRNSWRLSDKVQGWYYKNLMIFTRSNG